MLNPRVLGARPHLCCPAGVAGLKRKRERERGRERERKREREREREREGEREIPNERAKFYSRLQ